MVMIASIPCGIINNVMILIVHNCLDRNNSALTVSYVVENEEVCDEEGNQRT